MIKVEELIDKSFKAEDIKRLICFANISVMDCVANIINNEPHHFAENLNMAYHWFVTSMYTTYDSAKCIEFLSQIDKDSNEILNDCKDMDDLYTEIAYEIGTNSEITNNFSLHQRILLLTVAAKKIDIKFDFSWNL